jgi:hypothetical protein
MPRTRRPYLLDHLWHITRRCHKKEFLLQFGWHRQDLSGWLSEAIKRHGMVILLSSLMVLFLSGCAGNGHGARESHAAAAKERIHSMSGDVIPRLVGSWKLISFHSQDSSGQTAYPFGQDAQGRLIYEPDGRMAVQIMDPSRPRFSSDDPLVTSETEVRAAFGGYTAYYGTYSVNPDEQTIVHHIEGALLPNWVGTDQRRHFEFDGKVLTLQGPLRLGGVQGFVSLVWEHLP